MAGDAPRAPDPARAWVSVVIPTFDKAPYVAEAVASVLAQTDPGFELWVVDDGSTDGSAAVAEAAARADPRVRVLRQANAGVSAARNAGIEAARTEWVALLDADDVWRPGFLAAVRAAIDAHPDAAMVAAGYAFTSSGGAGAGEVAPGSAHDRAAAGRPRAGEGAGAHRADLLALWARQEACPVHASAVALRRDAIRAAGGFPVGMSLGEDLLTWLNVAAAGAFVHVPQVLAGYRVDAASSLARAPSRAAIAGHERLLEALERRVADGRCPPAIRDRQCATHLFHLVNASAPWSAGAFLLRRPGLWSVRHWSWVVLEALGLRRAVIARRLARRAAG